MDPSAPFFPSTSKKQNEVDPVENFSDIKSNPNQVFGAKETEVDFHIVIANSQQYFVSCLKRYLT